MRYLFSIVGIFLSLLLVAQEPQYQYTTYQLQFKQALDYAEQKRYDAAVPLLESVLAEASTAANFKMEAAFLLARCKLQLQAVEGELLMAQFLERYPETNKQTLAAFELGAYYFTAKKYATAVKYLSMVDLTMLNELDRLECNFKLGYAFMNLKEFEKAGTAFQRIKATKNKYTFAANYYLGYIYYKRELYEAAEQHLKKAYENPAYQTVVPPLLAQTYNKQKKYDTLIAYCDKMLKKEGSEAYVELNLLMAEAFYSIKKYKESATFFEISLDKKVELNLSSQVKYGLVLYYQKQYEKSIATLKKTAEINDTTGQLSAYYLGLNWLRLSNKQFAFNAFYQARKMKYLPDVTGLATLEYCRTGIELGSYDAVIASAKEYLAAYNGSEFASKINDALSEAYLHTNDYNSVIRYAETVKNRSASLSKVYQLATFYKALDFFNESRFEDALDYFDRSVQNDFDKETTALSYYYAAECFNILKDYESAIEYYNKVVKLSNKISPNMAALNYYGLGYAYYNKKEYANAAPQFKHFLESGVKDQKANQVCDAKIRIADCYYALKKLKDAAEMYDEASKQKCAYPDYCFFQLGLVQAALSRYPEAKSAFTEIVEQMPNSLYWSDALYNLGLIDFENSKYESAITDFSRLIQQNNSPTYMPLALQKRALAYNNLRHYQEAAADFSRIIKEFPEHKYASDAVLGLQEALANSGQNLAFDSLVAGYRAIRPDDANLERAALEQAKSLYNTQKYSEAIEKLQLFVTQYPTSASVPQLLYYTADSYYKTQDYTNAIDTYNKLVLMRTENYYTKALLKKADIHLETKDFENAIQSYGVLLVTTSNKKELNAAQNGLMMGYFETKDYDSSKYFATQLSKSEYSNGQTINKALLMQAKCALASDDENAIDYLISCTNAAKDQFGAEAHYLLANLLRNQGRSEASNEILFALIKNFGAFPKWYGRAFILLADNYAALKENYQAKATLISIIENSKDVELVQLAKERLAKLDNP